MSDEKQPDKITLLSPEVAQNLRLPKGMYKEDDHGIYIDMEDLNPKQRSATPGEMIGIFTELVNSDHPMAKPLIWGLAIFVGIPIVLGLVFVMLGMHRRPKNHVPPTFSYVPFVGVLLFFMLDPVGYVISEAKKLSAGFCIALTYTEFTVFPGRKKLTFAHGFKTLFDGVLVPSEPEIFKQIAEFAPSILDARFQLAHAAKKVELFFLASDLTLRILLRIALGQKLFDENDDDLVSQFQAMEPKLFSMWYLILKSWSGDSNPAHNLFKDMVLIVNDELQVRKNEPEGTVHNDLIDALLKANPEIGAVEIAAHIVMFVVSNHSDLSGTAAWSIYHIVKNKSLKVRVMAELSQAKLAKPDIGDLDLGSSAPLKTLTGVIREVGRRYAPLFLFNGSRKKQKMNDYDVYYCDLICSAPVTAALNETFFEKPLEFDPSRLLDDVALKRHIEQGKFVQFRNADNAFLGAAQAEKLVKAVLIPAILSQCDIDLVKPDYNFKPRYLTTFSTPKADSDMAVYLYAGATGSTGEAKKAAIEKKTGANKKRN
ncbi:cytochrome P450 [Entophlyctis helioformis]|nr:cytochrome P450 [Entophlyctis helioformis]